jgi:hypothetical protein
MLLAALLALLSTGEGNHRRGCERMLSGTAR